jgi:Zn finger protein HypA/HybF involved in hydrogenase expression|tara:strand:+ start:1985 stop:2227 length:243 start_codon:yes stop_codon:yes gene_type:complete
MKKIQDSEIIGYQTIEGKQVPMLKPEVHHRIYCKNCGNEVDSDEEATGLCSNCGEPWAVHKAKDILVKVIQIPLGSGTGE